MNTFERMTDRGHELVVFHRDARSGLRAIVAVHSTALGPGFGGARRWHYATEADALRDVLRLSEGMTYKAAAANIPIGGGKAVILLPRHKAPPTEQEARAAGRLVERLGGAYISAEDVGLSPRYVDWIRMETAHAVGGDATGGDPSPFTAEGVVNAMKAALAYTGRPADLAGLRIAIQGTGHVGANVARIAARAGASLVVADIDAEAARRVAEECEAQVVPPSEILATDCDVLCPCALGGVIDASVIRRLRCRIICGGANNVLDDYDEDGVALKVRGIVSVPDFVANAGGLIELAGIHLGLTEAARRRGIAEIEQNALAVLRAAESHPSTYAAALALARGRLAAGPKEQVHAG